jgi:SAM-dependent methyltransferase
MNQYLDGSVLYGDDFNSNQIEEWFRDEAEGYYQLESERRPGVYGYHALNYRHGFRYLQAKRFDRVLGIGSAFGDELAPIINRAGKITILEPSEGFQNARFEYVKPSPSGLMPFKDASFDLITCFGVLHHIPNVSAVLKEISRCLSCEGSILLREPIVSLGDWNGPRRGLTKRERGIPLQIFREIIHASGLTIERETKCMFSLTARLKWIMKKPVYNSAAVVCFDSLLCKLPIWSTNYHSQMWMQRFKPWAAFYILRKRS